MDNLCRARIYYIDAFRSQADQLTAGPLAERDVQLRAGQLDCPHDSHGVRVEHEQLIANGCEHSAACGEGGLVFRSALHERAFEHLLLFLWIESKKLRLLFDRAGASAAVIAAAAEDEATLQLPGNGSNALVRHEVTIIF